VILRQTLEVRQLFLEISLKLILGEFRLLVCFPVNCVKPLLKR
jgi:hypothetical protein